MSRAGIYFLVCFCARVLVKMSWVKEPESKIFFTILAALAFLKGAEILINKLTKG